MDHPHYRGLGQVGIMISMLGGLWAFMTNMALMSNLGEFGGGAIQLRFSFLVIAIAFAHSALLLRINTANTTVKSVRYLTLSIIATFTVVLVSNIMALGNFPHQAWRLFIVLAILNVLGTLATPLLHAATKEPKAS
ncbi:hypothetical protein [Acaryochloris sp. IP29b_bin.137]|uniref:hypothetical protein n=1 Tax=Acaryochloris sp. IP29b_bin.137 TaxID=2969217 RepID=UPI00260FFF19|nr:hypothetical protein [Acaryochloris sp. IP29b_bin.137]